MGREAVEDGLAPLLCHGVDQLEHVVDLEAREHIGEALVGQGFHDVSLNLVGQLSEQGGGAALTEEQVDHRPDLIGREVRKDRAEVGRVDAHEQPLGASMNPRREESAKDAAGYDGLGHAVFPGVGPGKSLPALVDPDCEDGFQKAARQARYEPRRCRLGGAVSAGSRFAHESERIVSAFGGLSIYPGRERVSSVA